MRNIFLFLLLIGNYYVIFKLLRIIKKQELEIKLLKEILERE